MAGKLKIIILVAIALVSFGATYFVSSILNPKEAPVAADSEAAEQGEGEQPMRAAIAAGIVSPVTFKMKANALNELLKEARLKVDAYRAKQKLLDNREKRIEMAAETLKKQAQELDVARAQLIPALDIIRQAKTDLEATRTRIGKTEKANLKRISKMYNKMDAASAAETLTIMCRGGQEDDAIKIIRYMSEKKAAGLLVKMLDRKLAAKICVKLKVFQEEG